MQDTELLSDQMSEFTADPCAERTTLMTSGHLHIMIEDVQACRCASMYLDLRSFLLRSVSRNAGPSMISARGLTRPGVPAASAAAIS